MNGRSQVVFWLGVVVLVLCSNAPAAEPVFAVPLLSCYDMPGGALTIGIDGFDADGDALTITAVSDDVNLVPFVPTGNRYARMHFVEQADGTVIGDILVQLFEGRSPLATQRFITLATNHVAGDGTLDPTGTPFYTDVVVHRVIEDFIIQTGDAANGDGTGGSPLGAFDDEVDPSLEYSAPGVLGMANAGANTNDSQFFITAAPTTWLNGYYTIFGQVICGWDTFSDIITRDPGSSPNFPIPTPLLQSVDIIDSPQDGTLSLTALAGFDGVARVTVTLDDGTGNLTEHSFVVPEPASLALLALGGVALLRRGRRAP